MAIYLPIQAINRSQKVRIGGQLIQPGVTSYVDISNGTTKRDLQRHTAIGAILVVGSLTASNADEVVVSGATTSAANLVITVAAGELRVRSTGVYVAVAGGTTTLSAADGTQDRTDLVWVNGTTGAQGHTSGALAPVGTSVAPAAVSGQVPLATYLVGATATAATLVADVRPR